MRDSTMNETRRGARLISFLGTIAFARAGELFAEPLGKVAAFNSAAAAAAAAAAAVVVVVVVGGIFLSTLTFYGPWEYVTWPVVYSSSNHSHTVQSTAHVRRRCRALHA